MHTPARSRSLASVVVLGLILAACSPADSEPTTTAAPSTTSPAPDTTAPGAGPDLSGRWQRTESTYESLDGMVVEVIEEGREAVIVEVPDNPFQFVVGDIKWRSIALQPDGTYLFEDLVREEGSGTESYIAGVIAVGDDGDTLEMTFPTSGTVQSWARVEG